MTRNRYTTLAPWLAVALVTGCQTGHSTIHSEMATDEDDNGTPPPMDAAPPMDAEGTQKDGGGARPGTDGGGLADAAPGETAGLDSAGPEAGGLIDMGAVVDGPSDRGPASCTGSEHPVCIDFEDGKIAEPWSAPKGNNAVEEGRTAHGRYAWHLSNLRTKPLLLLRNSHLGGIKDVMWGRFYLYMDPGAPRGHGALVKVFDQSGYWYEVGFESNAYIGNWHVNTPTGVPEKPLKSRLIIPGKSWVCVEFQFDGATPGDAQIWSDGAPVTFYEVFKHPSLVKVDHFTRFEIGINFYHGSSLISYEGNEAPAITDMWIDDVALDSKRIGCL